MNPATLWAEIAVEALVDGGLREVCVAPGSRSTALALAFAAHPDVRVYRHLDERSAGFFALGLALAHDRPAALLCTSGTATANFFPAIVEARMSQAPLLVLTADRPPELRHSGANQTIDQIRLYGQQVLWSVDVALPERESPAVALRNLRGLMARALATANGIQKGPVHLNFPFRKPFEPEAGHVRLDERRASEQRVKTPRVVRGMLAPLESHLAEVAALIAAHERGLIVCGPRCPGGDFAPAVAELSRRSGYPIMADPLSGLRYGPWVAETVVCGGYESILAQGREPWGVPEVVLRFGAVPTSKWLNVYLTRVAPQAPGTLQQVVHVRSNGVWADDSHRTSLFLQADEVLTCRGLSDRVPGRQTSEWQETIQTTEQAYWRTLAGAMDGDFFDGVVAGDLVELLPAEELLFAGNSLPVRHLDQFGAPGTKRLEVFGNRGASGIDGNTSTALGIAAARRLPVVLLVGDVTFYHDMNGLLAVGEHDLNLIVVLLNNGGGGIFRRLPVASFEPAFTDLFLTPHDLNFAHAARLYGLEYVQAGARDAFRREFAAAVAEPRARIIEVCTDGAADAARRQALLSEVLQAMGV